MLDRSLSHPFDAPIFGRSDERACGWAISDHPVGYQQALSAMETRAEAIARGQADELVWLLEHPPLYSAGVSAKPADLLQPNRFPVFQTGRGGQYTYHGPGQRVAYVMLDLTRRQKDVRAFVAALEAWIISALGQLGVNGEVRERRVGVWVTRRTNGSSPREEKIAAIGVKLRKWVSFHGISLNVSPNLDHFSGIVPCGQAEHGVTSLVDLGLAASMAQADQALLSSFRETFGPAVLVPPPALGSRP